MINDTNSLLYAESKIFETQTWQRQISQDNQAEFHQCLNWSFNAGMRGFDVLRVFKLALKIIFCINESYLSFDKLPKNNNLPCQIGDVYSSPYKARPLIKSQL